MRNVHVVYVTCRQRAGSVACAQVAFPAGPGNTVSREKSAVPAGEEREVRRRGSRW